MLLQFDDRTLEWMVGGLVLICYLHGCGGKKRDQHTRQVDRLQGLHCSCIVGSEGQELKWCEAWGRAACRASLQILSQGHGAVSL